MRVCRISCAPRACAGAGLRAQNNNNNNNVNFNGWFGWGKKETPPAPAVAVAVQEPEEDEENKILKQKYEIFLKTGVDTRTPEEKAAARERYKKNEQELYDAHMAARASENAESARICNERAHGHF